MEGKLPVWVSNPPRIRNITNEMKYTNLKFLGVVPAGSNLKDGPTYERYIHPITSELNNVHIQELIQIAGNKYYMSVPTLSNVEHSIKVFEDRPPIGYWNDVDKKFKCHALNYLNQQYGHLFNDCLSNSEELAEVIDYTKSPGYPATQYGFNSKGQLIQDDDFNLFLHSNGHLKQIPIWSVCPKKEFKELADLKALKIRLFTIPPHPLLYEQLRFGKKVSERLKLYKWSAYGFNPYSGGANNLANLILSKRVRLFYDISGWDKFLALLCDVFNIAVQNSTFDPIYQKNFKWMLINTMNYYFKTPKGELFLKNYGNPSGSGTTTRDNILAHIIIIAHALIECYYFKHGSFPLQSYLNEQIVRIFGDDAILSLDEDFEHILTEGYLAQHFHKYGLKLKFLYGGLDYDVEQMQFLGFNFTKKNNLYYPLYDMERLATSFVYQGNGSLSREAYVSRAFTLMVMSYPSEYFNTFYKAFQSLIDHVAVTPVTPIEASYVSLRNIPATAISSLFTGVESFDQIDFSFFLSSNGWRKETKDYGQCQSIKS